MVSSSTSRRIVCAGALFFILALAAFVSLRPFRTPSRFKPYRCEFDQFDQLVEHLGLAVYQDPDVPPMALDAALVWREEEPFNDSPRHNLSALSTVQRLVISSIVVVFSILGGMLLVVACTRWQPSRVKTPYTYYYEALQAYTMSRRQWVTQSRPLFKFDFNAPAEQKAPVLKRSRKFVPSLETIEEHPWVPFTFDGRGFLKALQSLAHPQAEDKATPTPPLAHALRPLPQTQTQTSAAANAIPPTSATKPAGPTPLNMLPGAVIYETPSFSSRSNTAIFNRNIPIKTSAAMPNPSTPFNMLPGAIIRETHSIRTCTSTPNAIPNTMLPGAAFNSRASATMPLPVSVPFNMLPGAIFNASMPIPMLNTMLLPGAAHSIRNGAMIPVPVVYPVLMLPGVVSYQIPPIPVLHKMPVPAHLSNGLIYPLSGPSHGPNRPRILGIGCPSWSGVRPPLAAVPTNASARGRM